MKASDVVGAHEADVRVQGKYGVNYRHYWVDEAEGKVFCLVDAPDKETATRVHREAHGLEAHTLYEVEQGALPPRRESPTSRRLRHDQVIVSRPGRRHFRVAGPASASRVVALTQVGQGRVECSGTISFGAGDARSAA